MFEPGSLIRTVPRTTPSEGVGVGVGVAVGAGVGAVVAIGVGTTVAVPAVGVGVGVGVLGVGSPPPPGSTGTVAVSELVLAPMVPGALVSTGNEISSQVAGVHEARGEEPARHREADGRAAEPDRHGPRG